jgi:hypothetical protein
MIVARRLAVSGDGCAVFKWLPTLYAPNNLFDDWILVVNFDYQFRDSRTTHLGFRDVEFPGTGEVRMILCDERRR